MQILRLCCAALLVMGLVACHPGSSSSPSNSLATSKKAVIYGKDDRRYTADHPDKTLQAMADAVTTQVYSSNVKTDSKTGEVTLTGRNFTDRIQASSSYGKLPLCADEPFRLDHAPGGCTGFLIAKNLLATAGHCVSKTNPASSQTLQYWCNNRKFVFGFRKGRKLHKDDVVGCKRVLVHAYTSKPKDDIAVIELDRDITGIKPLALAPKQVLVKGDGVAIIGHPHGTYQKIASGGKVNDPRTATRDYFSSSLDTMPGNSGSPVISTKTYKVVAVHVRGKRPAFLADKDKKCNRTNNSFSDDKGGQGENYLTRLEPKTCTKNADCTAHQDCLQGRCYYKTADLIVKDVKLPVNKATRGVPLSISYTIEYKGTYVGTLPIRVGLWWSSNSTLCTNCGQDKVIKTTLVKDLKPGKTYKGTFTFEAQSYFTAGKQYVGIYVDDYRDSIKKPSPNGNLYESNEVNNKQALPFTLETCKSDCSNAGDTRCQDDKVQICNKQPSGCLLWELQKVCKGTEVCSQGQCKLKCTDNCPKEGDSQCKDGSRYVCQKLSSGCLDWMEQKCDATDFCSEGSCVAKKAEGELCKTKDECEGGACLADKNKELRCRILCRSDDMCKSSTIGPNCKETVCSPQDGSCQANSDCKSDQNCVNKKCVAKTSPDKENPPNTGCQCSSSSSNTDSFPLNLLFLLPLLAFRLFSKENSRS